MMDKQLKKLNKKPRKTGKPITWVLIAIILLSLILFLPIGKKEIIISQEDKGKTIIHLKDPLLERVNLLFLGIPGQGYVGENLTDTIIIINSTPRGKNPIAISIPRDFLVKFPDNNYYTKINSLYKSGQTKEKGIELITSSIKEITDLDIDYFFVLDLEGVKKIVDKLGGIDINVKNDIYDPRFPVSVNSYEIFSLAKGAHHLDGETTLKYIRTRHGPEADFGRIEHQQQVIDVLKDKILSLNPVWNLTKVLSIWKTLNKHTYTNIGLNDIKYTWNLIKKTDFDEIEFITLDNQLLISDQAILEGKTASVLKPKFGLNNYSEIKNYIKELIKI